jgi:alcohol dehydrogenase YqhD (iron-dependent ADH family)
MRSLITASRAAAANPQNYEARSNIMWTATWALNTLIAKGKTTDWMVHMMGQSVGAYTDATHGMTLAAVTLPYFRHILPCGLPKFKRFAVNVWGISAEGKTDEETALAGLEAMKAWMQEIGLMLSLRELGATEDMLDGIAEGTFLLRGGYKPELTTAEVREILAESM